MDMAVLEADRVAGPAPVSAMNTISGPHRPDSSASRPGRPTYIALFYEPGGAFTPGPPVGSAQRP
jgi:hypothetical protein